MQLEQGAWIRLCCLQWCQLILRSPASPRSQLLDRQLGAGGFFVAIVRLISSHLATLSTGLNHR
nr:MAG TPA: hypothetical protein [Caudoviricetes sp.]